jgi:hypothetical protein
LQKLLLRLSVVLIAAVPLLKAQADRAGITGTVSDPSGAVITGAKIEAKNVATGAVFEVGSSQTGNYLLGQLPVGKYELTVTVTGFKEECPSGYRSTGGSDRAHQRHARGGREHGSDNRDQRSRPAED